MSELIPSTEQLPPSDPRDAAIKELDDLCRQCVELAHRLQAMDERDPAQARMFGRLEERIYNLIDTVHSRQRFYNLDHGYDIVIAHTDLGLPIRVRKPSRLPIWGV